MKYLLAVHASSRIDLIWLNDSDTLSKAVNEGLQKILALTSSFDDHLPAWGEVYEIADSFLLDVTEVTEKRRMKKEKELEIEQRRVYEYLKEKFEG